MNLLNITVAPKLQKVEFVMFVCRTLPCRAKLWGKLIFCSPGKSISIVFSFFMQEFYMHAVVTVTGILWWPYPVNTGLLGMQKPRLGLEKNRTEGCDLWVLFPALPLLRSGDF